MYGGRIWSAMDQSNNLSSARSELRQHRRCVVPPACRLSFAPFAPTISLSDDAEGKGVVINPSAGGCSISSEVGVTVGDAMSLVILLPGELCPTTIGLGPGAMGAGSTFWCGIRIPGDSRTQSDPPVSRLHRSSIAPASRPMRQGGAEKGA